MDLFKNFFLKFLTVIPSVGFKIIVVNKSGFKNINVAITDLTFHLINKGIKHENETGRAPLPRLLQVRIDDEEKGSDKIKLENLEERLHGQKIDGLGFDSFEALESEKNLFLQVADLFTASVNRKLHKKEGKIRAKDELADYILDLLNFDITNIDKSNVDIDNSTVFNLMHNKK